MSKAPTVCGHPGCPNDTPCPEHTPKRPAWQHSNRRARLPNNWRDIRARVLRRDGHRCYVCRQPGANEVDHIQRGDDHRLSNLAAICERCHKAKTAREATAARATARRQRQQADVNDRG